MFDESTAPEATPTAAPTSLGRMTMASLLVWGGKQGDKLWLNIFDWYWAIAEGGRPSDLKPEDIAPALAWAGVDQARAADIIARADLYFAANGRSNARSGAFQRYARFKKTDLRDHARRKGIPFSGWDLKDELIRRIVDAELPVIRFTNGEAVA
jgi:hypothetical protein